MINYKIFIYKLKIELEFYKFINKLVNVIEIRHNLNKIITIIKSKANIINLIQMGYYYFYLFLSILVINQ